MTTRWAALYVHTLNVSLEKGRLLTSFSTSSAASASSVRFRS